MPAFSGSIETWTNGSWTSPLNDVSIHPVTSEWTELSWVEENTDDETLRYVRVDLLDNTDTVLQSNLSGTVSGSRKIIDLSMYPSTKIVDIKIKFNLSSKDDDTPIISDIQLR